MRVLLYIRHHNFKVHLEHLQIKWPVEMLLLCGDYGQLNIGLKKFSFGNCQHWKC